MHRKTTTRRFALQAILASMASYPALSSAQTYPAAPVRIIMPFGPGGADSLFRLVAERLQQSWGQPVIVDYKPGAATVVGTDYVTKSKPDGL
ncbi:MAG: transporter, partial [Ramlibacter sp.]|nr:transporter [Ramlibacter sp.]